MATSANLTPPQDSGPDGARLHTLAQLAGSVSHAIQSPLTTIFLHADILEEELQHWQHDNRTQLLDSLRVIREEVTRVHDLVEQHLLLSRLPALVLEPEDVGAFVELLGRAIKGHLAPRGIEVRLAEKAELGLVAMHRKALQRALLYLLDVVVDVNPESGAVTLLTRNTAGSIQLEIRCEGACTSPEQLAHFLEKGRNEHSYTALGFSLAHEIVTAHGGTIEIASPPGIGITITVSLPTSASQTSAEGSGR
jgi:K+-sensing histidine kinase KdpD